jgi:5-methylcytosine-specific restriction endonuclease McrA
MEKTGPWWNWYRKYLKSPKWKKIRHKCILRDKYCQICEKEYSKKNCFVAHHISYLHVGQADWQELEDLRLLCCDCHDELDNPEFFD